MNWRRLLHRDWLCQGCFREGSRRWLTDHACPEPDEFERSARELFEKNPGPWLLASQPRGERL